MPLDPYEFGTIHIRHVDEILALVTQRSKLIDCADSDASSGIGSENAGTT